VATHKVIVVGIDTPIGLTIVRELGERGVEVHGIANNRQAVGLYSRHLHKGYVYRGRDKGLLDLLNRIAAGTGARFLMTISESNIVFLNEHAAEIPTLERLFPDRERMRRVLDKETAAGFARRAGIAVPETIVLPDLAGIDRVERYPVVLKWGEPGAVLPRLSELKIPFLKSEYCYDASELRRALSRYEAVGTFPLVQEYCDGYGLGQMILMHKGEPILLFQHRRIHEWPPEGGFSSLCESVGIEEHRALRERSIELLRLMEWEGPAMVEYRYDPKTDRATFLEVNGRFWGSLPLAYHAGAHFAWATYAAMALGEPARDTGYRSGLRCRYFIPDLKRALLIAFRPERIQNRMLRFSRVGALAGLLLDSLRPGTKHYIFSFRDPLPWLLDGLMAVTKPFR